MHRFWRGNKQQMALGLEVQAQTVRAVLLQRGHGGGVQLLASQCFDGVQPAAEGALAPQAQQVAAALAAWWRGLGVAAPRVVAGLPGEVLARHRLPLPPGLHEDEQELLVQAEAAQRWGLAAPAYQLDFAADAATPEDGSVLLVAAPSGQVQWLHDWVQCAGLQLAVLELVGNALQLAAWQSWQGQHGAKDDAMQAILVLGDGQAWLWRQDAATGWRVQDIPVWPHAQWLMALQQALPAAGGGVAMPVLWVACAEALDASTLQQWEQASGWQCCPLQPLGGMAGPPPAAPGYAWWTAAGLALRGLDG